VAWGQRDLRVTRRLLALLTLLITLVAFIIVEVYAHSYVRGLPVISEEEALDLVYFCSNGSKEFSYTIHGCTVRWRAIWSINKPTSSVNYARIYLFKIEQNSSFLVQSLEIIPVALRATANNSNSHFHAWLDEVFQEDNYTEVIITYDFGEIGTYNVDFGLVVKIYEKTLLGYLPLEEVKVPIEESLYYGP
jgi:hypothetical protein